MKREREAEAVEWMWDILQALRASGVAEEFFFHGTSDQHLDAILKQVLLTTDVLMDDGEGEEYWAQGTYWATPRLAANYAIDTILERDVDKITQPILVAVLREDLAEEGEFAPDQLTLEYPPRVLTLDMGSEDLVSEWRECKRQDWESFFSVYKTLVCLGPVGSEKIVVLQSRECVNKLHRHLEAQAELQSSESTGSTNSLPSTHPGGFF